jgi:dTDP-4-dehydrorhamnose 3,5-epimerase
VNVTPTGLAGCVRLTPRVVPDDRGLFVKTFQSSVFNSLRLDADWREQFYSRSRRGVIRGLHFQRPPADHAKLVSCVRGRVFDVAVDLRKGSPTYGRAAGVELDDEGWEMLFIPSGFAHGFAALSDDAVMAYLTTSEHDPACDTGIRWDSAGIRWPVDEPIVSERDRALPALDGFDSPFLAEAVDAGR